jgi:hypothetical protein
VGPVVRPRRIVLTCADAGLIVQTIHWTSWGHRIAKGRGTVRYNDCDPFCAGGHYHYVRGARLRMSRIRYCANTGHDQYHRLVIHSRAFKNRRHRYAMTVGCHTFGALRVGTRAAAACPPPQDVHTAYRVHPARGVLDGQAIDPEVEPAK